MGFYQRFRGFASEAALAMQRERVLMREPGGEIVQQKSILQPRRSAAAAKCPFFFRNLFFIEATCGSVSQL